MPRRRSGRSCLRGAGLSALGELPGLAARLGLPLILKPARAVPGLAADIPKVILIERDEDVAAVQHRHADCAGVPFLAQEYIPGADRQHLSVAVCLDRRLSVVATFTARKRRQANHGAGVGTCVESFQDPEAEEAAIALLRGLGYVGVAEVEFKRHAHIGRLYVIEVNPRLWTQVVLAGACGINFPLLFYRLAAGLPELAQPVAWRSRTWQDLWEDFYQTFRRGGYRDAGDVSVAQWIGQAVQAQVGPYSR